MCHTSLCPTQFLSNHYTFVMKKYIPILICFGCTTKLRCVLRLRLLMAEVCMDLMHQTNSVPYLTVMVISSGLTQEYSVTSYSASQSKNSYDMAKTTVYRMSWFMVVLARAIYFCQFNPRTTTGRLWVHTLKCNYIYSVGVKWSLSGARGEKYHTTRYSVLFSSSSSSVRNFLYSGSSSHSFNFSFKKATS